MPCSTHNRFSYLGKVAFAGTVVAIAFVIVALDAGQQRGIHHLQEIDLYYHTY